MSGRARELGPRGPESLIGRAFNYAHNPWSTLGIALATIAGISIVVFLLVEGFGHLRNPYVGIFAYVILPAFFVLGLVLIPFGMWRRRRILHAEGVSRAERSLYPRLDFNDPQLRRMATLVLSLTAVNAVLFGSASFFAVEHMESVEFCGTSCHSVMQPEYMTYLDSPHSRIACVECHIGPGASHFMRSKIDGMEQLWKTVRGTYPRPIETPVENLRPARETCEQCHWPGKYYADKVRVFARFETDEANTPSYTAMVFQPGGGARELGQHGGVHWRHLDLDNRIRYVADAKREKVLWVELTAPDGEVRVYTRDGEDIPSSEEIAERARIMDCIDCHNRPTHRLEAPSNALDQALAARADLRELPYFKNVALEAIEAGGYTTHAEGVATVQERILSYYRGEQVEVWQERPEIVETAGSVAGRIFARSVFPEMRTNWETHPDHIGHEQSPGCFRCHDEELATADGEHVITMDCETCHLFLVDGAEEPPNLAALANGG